jgi:membrane fusion protein (multidrug efflux system)
MVHNLETVKPGDPLLKIVGTDNLEVSIQVPSHWLRWLKIGTPFFIHINEINQKVNAQIIRTDPEIESVSQTIKLTGRITEQNSELLPGMSGQAIFPEVPEKEDQPNKAGK